MPLFNTIEARRVAKRMHRVREKPFTAYGIAVTAVAIATLIRWAIGGYVLEGIAFAVILSRYYNCDSAWRLWARRACHDRLCSRGVAPIPPASV